MFQLLRGYDRRDRLEIKILSTVGVVYIEDKIQGLRFRWFGYVKR